MTAIRHWFPTDHRHDDRWSLESAASSSSAMAGAPAPAPAAAANGHGSHDGISSSFNERPGARRGSNNPFGETAKNRPRPMPKSLTRSGSIRETEQPDSLVEKSRKKVAAVASRVRSMVGAEAKAAVATKRTRRLETSLPGMLRRASLRRPAKQSEVSV